MTIGNLPKEIRCKPSRHGQILLGYLPASKLKFITNKAARRRMLINIYHACVRRLLSPLVEAGIEGLPMSDGIGTMRRVHPILAVFVGDYPEQVEFTLGHLFRAESARNPSSPSTPAGIFPTSPSEIEVCSKHLNLAENVLMHSH